MSLRKRGTFAEVAKSILAWGKTIGQAIHGVKLRTRRKRIRGPLRAGDEEGAEEELAARETAA
jgi:hypothetical protein